jgi:hypothetical protein
MTGNSTRKGRGTQILAVQSAARLFGRGLAVRKRRHMIFVIALDKTLLISAGDIVINMAKSSAFRNPLYINLNAGNAKRREYFFSQDWRNLKRFVLGTMKGKIADMKTCKRVVLTCGCRPEEVYGDHVREWLEEKLPCARVYPVRDFRGIKADYYIVEE